MARPTKNDISSGNQGWDGAMDDNDEVLFNGPLPIHEHAGDESDLQSTFPANQYDRCFVMVNHTSLGWSLYISDGTAWNRALSVDSIAALTDITDSSGGAANNTVAAVSGSGDDATINDNFADLTAKVNAIHSLLRDHGLAT